MTPEAWTFFSVLTASVLGLMNEVVRTRRRVDEVGEKVGTVDRKVASAATAADVAAASAGVAAEAAGEAAVQLKPLTNGFSSSVLQSLQALKEGQRELHHEIQDVKKDVSTHLHDHVREGMKRNE